MSSQLGASFLLTELDLANTFLDISHNMRREGDRKRSIANAWKAYEAVGRLAPHLGITDYELLAITERLQALRMRLAKIETQ
jgi:hypothetical protein